VRGLVSSEPSRCTKRLNMCVALSISPFIRADHPPNHRKREREQKKKNYGKVKGQGIKEGLKQKRSSRNVLIVF
jgi:hypothetical protein